MHALLPAKVTAVEESRVAQRLVEIVQCHRKLCLGHGGRIGEASLGVEGERRAVDVFDDLRGVYRIAGFPERGGERPVFVRVVNQGAYGDIGRSEEHTSELQSLMRISYAVFCLKKKITKNTIKDV